VGKLGENGKMRKDRTKSVRESSGGSDDVLNAEVINAEVLNKDAIEKLAYELWINRGCPEGSADEDWIQAERTLQAAAEAEQPAIASNWKGVKKSGTAMTAAG
jgi:hypothetical protein